MIKMKKSILCGAIVLSMLSVGIPVLATTNYAQASSNTSITMEQAKELALKDAGLKKSNVDFSNTTTYRQNKTKVHKLVFKTSTKKYVYKINASTGDIIGSNTNGIGSTKNTRTKNKTNSKTSNNLISTEKAQSIAFSKAGVSADSVRKLKINLDEDNGKMLYEIEFKAGNMEYESEIDAKTGKILSWESDRD